ncbi:MAG: ABC-2 transporter permease [Phycisphaerae bacterium]|nr:ABC-2 transporter permease [Phycisphaerae bacterium]
MTSLKTYLWKEWMQNQGAAFSALAAVSAVSVVSLLVDATDAGEGLLLLGGPILAVILGVHALALEQGAVGGFWQSRPIHTVPWVVSKYIMGLLILAMVCGAVVLIQVILVYMAGMPQRVLTQMIRLIFAYGWIVLAMYSTAFVLGQWIRGIVHALILSMGAVAMILLVPVIVPWLNTWSLIMMRQVRPNVLHTPGYAVFVAGIVTFNAAMVCVCYGLAKRRIRIDVDQRTIAWSTVILLLVLGTAALFPIGHNLSPEQIVALPVARQGNVDAMAMHENRVLVLLNDGLDRATSRGRRFGVMEMEVNAGEAPGRDQGVSLGEPIWFLDTRDEPFYVNIYGFLWSKKTPSVAYFLMSQYQRKDGKPVSQSCRLLTLNLEKTMDPVVQDQNLTSLLPGERLFLSASLDMERLYIYQTVKEDRLLIFSLEDPERPELASDEIVSPLGFSGPRPGRNHLTEYQIRTIPKSQQNLRITHDLTRRQSWPWAPMQDDHILGVTEDWILTLFEEDRFDTDRIVLKSIAQRPRNAVQKLLTLGYTGVIDSLENWAICGDGLGATVYRISEGNEIRRVGHYAAGKGFRAMVILPDKRVILGNDKLHILRLPKDD